MLRENFVKVKIEQGQSHDQPVNMKQKEKNEMYHNTDWQVLASFDYNSRFGRWGTTVW